MKGFYPLLNTIKQYTWGSIDGIPQFTGIQNPEKRPLAELWLGAHPGAPSMIQDESDIRLSLDTLIAAEPEQMLGKSTVTAFGKQLPFLFKILSASTSLSLQVHPDKRQAEEGFSHENNLHIPLSASTRNFKDNNHKPEILVALTDFSAMCGFRNPTDTQKLISLLEIPDLDAATKQFLIQGSYIEFCHFLLDLPDNDKHMILSQVDAKLPELHRRELASNENVAFHIVEDLRATYPSDIGVLAPLYLNVISLKPGQAIYLPSGIMHSYLKGTGLELMSNSDNVLRGGLTPKHIDVQALLSILKPDPYTPAIIEVPKDAGMHTYRTPSKEFAVSVIKPQGSHGSFVTHGPCIMLGGNDAGIEISSENYRFPLRKGTSVFIPGSSIHITYTGSGTAYMASLPEDGTSL